MSIASLIRSMAEAGAPAEAIALAVEAIEAAEARVSVQREAARDRKRRQRAVMVTGQSRDTDGTVTDTTPAPSLSPPDPPKPTPTPVSITTHAREADDFEVFWRAYPRKTAKAEARKAFSRAVKKTPMAEVLGGLERAKAGWVDANFIPHAATWLNGERWNDEAAPIPRARQPHDRPNHDAKFDARQANLARAFAGADHAAGQRWEP